MSIGAVKNARGTLVGWTLPDLELERIATMSDVEVVLEQRPTALFIKLKNPTKHFDNTYGVGPRRGLFLGTEKNVGYLCESRLCKQAFFYWCGLWCVHFPSLLTQASIFE